MKYRYVKKVLDIVFAIILLSILAVPMLIIALVIKLTSPGKIIFKQERYGENSKKFTLYKFRTMRDNSPEIANQYFTDINMYVTKFGGFLRKTSLDELPQLINILCGEMSFVGPRPLASTDLKVVEMRKLNGSDQCKPGITGLAQVNGRNSLDDQEKAYWDHEYVSKMSFLMDIKLICITFIKVLCQDNINIERKN